MDAGSQAQVLGKSSSARLTAEAGLGHCQPAPSSRDTIFNSVTAKLLKFKLLSKNSLSLEGRVTWRCLPVLLGHGKATHFSASEGLL